MIQVGLWKIQGGFFGIQIYQIGGSMKTIGKLIIHPKLKTSGYYKDGKFVKVLTREEYEEMIKIAREQDKKSSTIYN